MEQSIKRKINIFGKVGKIITTVIIVLLLVAEGFLLTGGVIVALLPKDAVAVDVNGTASLRADVNYFGVKDGEIYAKPGGADVKLGDLGDDTLHYTVKDGIFSMDFGVKDMHLNLWDALKLMGVIMVKIAAWVVALYFFKALMKAFSTCDTPFCDGVIRKMRNFAIALIPTMAVSAMTGSLMGFAFTGDLSIGEFDLIPVAFVLVVFILTAIFRYGAQLQKQYDETV